jgi:hypothetical protein
MVILLGNNEKIYPAIRLLRKPNKLATGLFLAGAGSIIIATYALIALTFKFQF